MLSLKLIIYLFNIIIPTQCQIYILSSRLVKDLTKAKVGRKVNMEDVRRSVVIFHLLFRHRLPSTHFPWANILHLFTRPFSRVESISGNSVHLSICLSVITSYSFPFSDSKLTQHPPVDLSHATSPTLSNVPHPCLPCPPVNWFPFPVNWSPNEQDHSTDLFPFGVMCQLDIFQWLSP